MSHDWQSAIQAGLRSGVNRELLTGRHAFPNERLHVAVDAAIQGRAQP